MNDAALVSLLVNGAPHDFVVGATVTDVVAAVAPSPKGIAVAVNAEVIPRSVWHETLVAAGDEVEVLTAAQGG